MSLFGLVSEFERLREIMVNANADKAFGLEGLVEEDECTCPQFFLYYETEMNFGTRLFLKVCLQSEVNLQNVYPRS